MAGEDGLSDEQKRYPVYLMAEGKWRDFSHDCSGFARAVASEAGVPIMGNANQMIDHMRKGGGWISLGHDAARASRMSGDGYLVVGGKQEHTHGHVVVVVPGTDHGMAMGYWGSLGRGIEARNARLSQSFTHAALPTVEYWAYPAARLRKRS